MAEEKHTEVPDNEFHVGITMAGAVSAGCYTGGVMDYLFEILDLWEKAKQEKLDDVKDHYHKIPQHKVVIDAIGGASAGGMNTAMSAIYALNGKVNPVTNASEVGGKRNNIFYDSWVLLNDDEERKTFDRVWDLDDIKDGKVTSFLNSAFIDKIADQAFPKTGNLQASVNALPSYVSKKLEMLLSHCSLRGIPMEIEFKTPVAANRHSMDAPSHSTFEHLTISYYKLNEGNPPVDSTSLWLNPYDGTHADIMRLATKATGAFPLGLQFREFSATQLPAAYIKSVAEDIVFRSFGKSAPSKYPLKWNSFLEPFNFVTVDGGTVNNEPFGEVLSVLQSRYGTSDEQRKHYGLVMIDPFPDFPKRQDEYKTPDDLLSMISPLLRTLREQAKVKRAETLDALSTDYYRGVIYPVKRDSDPTAQDNPIACASIGAFGGFLDINFRHHDFFLGRNNARNFFRYFFSFEYIDANNCHAIHKAWTPEMVEAFKVVVNEKIFLPIIPDINLLRERTAGNLEGHRTYSVPERPLFDPASLFSLREKMEDRFEKILELTKANLEKKQKEKGDTPKTDEYMSENYPTGWFDKVKGWFIRNGTNWIFNATKGGLARRITEMALRWMLKDLESKGLLK